MQDFINYVLKYRDSFTQVSIGYGETKSIQDFVVKRLNLNNLKELRDRHEGVVFLKNFTTKIVGVIGTRKMLQLSPVEWDKINPKDYKPKLQIGNKEVQIISFVNGELPVVNKVNNKPAILLFNRENKYISICGYATADDLNDKKNTRPLKNIMTKGRETKVNFIAFDKLRCFKNLEDLKKIMN